MKVVYLPAFHVVYELYNYHLAEFLLSMVVSILHKNLL